MTILVTGSAGFIGSHLCEKLIDLGHEVIGIDNFDPFYPREFKLLNMRGFANSKRFFFYEADICDTEALHQIFSSNKIDAVVHLAAKAGVRPSIQSISDYYNVNVNGTIAILECMKLFKVKTMLFASSSSVYGNNTKVPFSESDNVDFPISPYASTKKSAELVCHVYSHLYNFNITCLRFFTVFGPRQRPDLAIHKFTRLIDQNMAIPIFGDGSTSRDYTYIDDIINGIEGALKCVNGFNIYNLGESHVNTLKQLIETIERAMQKKAIFNVLPLQPGDVPVTYADISKARKEINYKPKFNLEDGIKNFVEWYMNNKNIFYPEIKELKVQFAESMT